MNSNVARNAYGTMVCAAAVGNAVVVDAIAGRPGPAPGAPTIVALALSARDPAFCCTVAERARTTPSGDGDREAKHRRLWIIVGVAVALGVITRGPWFVADYNADQRADDLEAELAAAAARIPDQALADLATQHLVASYTSGEADPLLEALGQRYANGTIWGEGDGTVSLSFKVSWGLADRCVHLLLRPGQPPRTDTTRSPSCQARVP